MSKHADSYISIPVEVYDDLITNQIRLDLLRRVVMDELDGQYQIVGQEATKTVKLLLGIRNIRKEEHNDNPYVD